MSELASALASLLGRLAHHEARFAVVGGLAVSARTQPRFTRDADVCVATAGDRESESLVRSLQADGYRVVALVEQETTGRLATVRLAAREDIDAGVLLDLLFASSGIETEVVDAADRMELFEGIDAPIATVPSLIALKVLSRDDTTRPQDRVDLVELLAIADSHEITEAGRLLGLIEERGFARGRDLAASLETLQAELG